MTFRTSSRIAGLEVKHGFLRAAGHDARTGQDRHGSSVRWRALMPDATFEIGGVDAGRVSIMTSPPGFREGRRHVRRRASSFSPWLTVCCLHNAWSAPVHLRPYAGHARSRQRGSAKKHSTTALEIASRQEAVRVGDASHEAGPALFSSSWTADPSRPRSCRSRQSRLKSDLLTATTLSRSAAE